MKTFKSFYLAGLALALMFLGTLSCGNGTNPVTILAIVPQGPTLVLKGDVLQFTANRTDVTWSVQGGASNGTIDADGSYTPPTTLPVQSQVTVQAQSSDGQTDDALIELHTAASIAFGPTQPVNDSPLPGLSVLAVQVGNADRLAVRMGSVQIDSVWANLNDPMVPGIFNVFYSQNLDFAGFSPEENIGDDPAGNQNPSSIETDGNENPGILYMLQGSPSRVFFLGSGNQGASFNSPVPISTANPSFAQTQGVLRIDAQNRIHAIFVQIEGLAPGDENSVQYVRSDDGGATWSSQVPVFVTSTDTLTFPHFAVDPAGNLIAVCYTESNDAIAFVKSSNGGASFDPPIPIEDNTGDQVCRVARGPLGEIYVSHGFNTGAGSSDLLLVKSTNGGNSFGAPTTVNTDPINLPGTVAYLSVDDLGRIDMVWSADLDNSGPPNNLMYARSVNGGGAFSDDIPIFTAGSSDLVFPHGLRHDETGRTYVQFISVDSTEGDVLFMLGE